MYTLLLDSSNIKLVVGLAKDNKVIDSICYDAWQRQSEYMINDINSILEKNGINAKDLGCIVSTKGPGSYTGVRISLTIAKIMAYALKLPLILVSSLEILKNNSLASLCVLNARSGRSYVGIYENGKIIQADCIMQNEDVLKLNEANNYCLCGDTEYLNQVGFQSNICEELLKISLTTKPEDNVLAVKPVYLKD